MLIEIPDDYKHGMLAALRSGGLTDLADALERGECNRQYEIDGARKVIRELAEIIDTACATLGAVAGERLGECSRRIANELDAANKEVVRLRRIALGALP